MISNVHSLMLSLLADCLHGQVPAPISAELWPAVFSELQAQSVFALPAPYISPLDDCSRKQYTAAVAENLQIFYTLMEDQQEVLRLLDRHGIPVVILKGAAAAAAYLHPEYRCMGDIDILVLPKDFEKAYNAFVSEGYSAKDSLDAFYRHIGIHTPNGIEVELHNFFADTFNREQNSFIDELLFHAIPARSFVSVSGYTVPVLPPLENGIALLSHMNQHLRIGLGLRQIIDWMVYVEKYLDDAFWQAEFSDAAEKCGLKKLAMVTTAMCQKYLGLKQEITWCSYEPVCDKLMEYILMQGNFGRKTGITHKTVHVLHLFRNPVQLFIKAQRYGCYRLMSSKYYKWLKPFAWLYQLLRWFVLGIKHGVSPKMLRNAAAVEQEETDFLDQLGVT